MKMQVLGFVVLTGVAGLACDKEKSAAPPAPSASSSSLTAPIASSAPAVAAKPDPDATKRAAMLASDDESDWEALQKQFAGTPEATAAAAKLAAAQTLCGDLDRHWALYAQLAKDADAALDRHSTGLAQLPFKFPDSAAQSKEKDRLIEELDRAAGDLKSRVEKAVSRVHSHRIAKGEEPAQRELEKLFTGLRNTLKALDDQVDTVTARPVVEKRISDWEDLWKKNADAVYKPGREKVLAACKK